MFILSYKKKSWKKFSGKTNITSVTKKGTAIISKNFLIRVYIKLASIDGTLMCYSRDEICKFVDKWEHCNPYLKKKLDELKDLKLKHLIIVTGREGDRTFFDLHICLSNVITLYTGDFFIDRQDISFDVKQSYLFHENQDLFQSLVSRWRSCYGTNSIDDDIDNDAGLYLIKNPGSPEGKYSLLNNLLITQTDYVEITRKCFVFRVDKYFPRETFMQKRFNEKGKQDFTANFVCSSELNCCVDNLINGIRSCNNAQTVYAITYPKQYLSDEYSLFLIVTFNYKKTLFFEVLETLGHVQYFLKDGDGHTILELYKHVIFPAPIGFTQDKLIELFENNLKKVSQNECLFIEKNLISNTFVSLDIPILFRKPSITRPGRMGFIDSN